MPDSPTILSMILQGIKPHVVPGVSTYTLDSLIAADIERRKVFSFNKGYHPSWAKFAFPAVSCISVNDTIAHGIPSRTIVLQEGDIVNIDIGIKGQDGKCADANFSLPVGQISEKDKMLLYYAKKTLYAGIEKVKAGVKIREIARAMESKAAERKFVINHQLNGHGIGEKMHEKLTIYQITNPFAHHMDSKKFDDYEKYMEVELKENQTICLEPYLTYSDKWGFVDDSNGWSFKTKDGKKSAGFEHMIKVLENGYQILTTHFSYKKGDLM